MAGCGAAALSTAQTRRQNLLLVLADDLGYGDLGCYSGDAKTPNLDRFAGQGVRFTNCYSAAANCSPARTGLMTGRTPYRAGIQNWIPMLSPMHLRKEEVTIASVLKRAGYATCHVGKWHLNGWFNLPGQPQPGDHGFDHWFSTQNNALPSHHNPYNFVRNGVPMGPQQGYSADIVAREAIHWLKSERDPAKPFFQYVCFHEPHEPIATERRFGDLYPNKPPAFAAHHGNISQMDNAFGQLMRALDELKLREDTLVLFTSDNGPAITNVHPHGSTGPLREKKGHVYEGGIRVPGIVRWPGRAKAGVTSDEPICGVDWLPTACEASGVAAPTHRPLDGASWLPALRGEKISRATPLYWQFNAAGSAPKVAMRVGDWKILARLTGPEVKQGASIVPAEQRAIKTAELAAFELYNLTEDVGEKHDRSTSDPTRLKEMSALLTTKYHEVRDECPVWPEWADARYETGRIEWPSYFKPRQ
jgi:arylsulfatase A